MDPEVEKEVRVQGGRNLMCWAELINGEVILHWFDDGTLYPRVYLDMLNEVVWPKFKTVSTRRIFSPSRMELLLMINEGVH